MVSLKENKKMADLEGGTLYAIVLKKLPHPLLSQYYRWIKENGSMESLEELRHWVAEEAEYQVQASEIILLSMVCPVLEVYEERA